MLPGLETLQGQCLQTGVTGGAAVTETLPCLSKIQSWDLTGFVFTQALKQNQFPTVWVQAELLGIVSHISLALHRGLSPKIQGQDTLE